MGRWFPGWRMTAFTLFFLPLLLGLGTWQLNRAAYKEQLQERLVDRLAEQPSDIQTVESLSAQDAAFLRVRVSGRVLAPDRYFLVDNQVHAGRPGYWVITPVVDAQDTIWLVNRGWVPAPQRRADLPEIPPLLNDATLIGHVWPDTGLIPQFAEDALSGWPRRLQRLDVEAMGAQLAAEAGTRRVMPMEIRLERGSAGVLQPARQLMRSGADRHRGYAATWFGLALTLVIAVTAFTRRRAVTAAA